MIRMLYPCEYLDSVFSIDYRKLYQLGYRGILLDIDNTLVLHGADSTPEVDQLFREMHQAGLKTLLLSNNSEERIQRFLANIQSLYIAEADKPAPHSYQQALTMLGIPREQAVMVGDQIFTDIYGANRCGIDSILVHFLRREGEWWPGKRRLVEKLILFCRRLDPGRRRIGDIVKKERGARDAAKAT